MVIIPWTTLSLVIDGDDLVVARVSASPLGVRTTALPRMVGVGRHGAALVAEEARRTLARTVSGPDAANDLPVMRGVGRGGRWGERLTLTVPAQWCSFRPIALRRRGWEAARAEIVRSLAELFPLAPADAMVGLIDRRGEEGPGGASPAGGGSRGGGGGGGGYLVVIDRARLALWLEAISRTLGREVDEVLAPQMAMLGLGLQGCDRAEVVENGAGGVALAHRLMRGEVIELGRRFDPAEGSWPQARLALSDHAAPAGGARVVGAEELATAAALAGRVAPGRYSPLLGRAPRATFRWAAPAAAAALTLAVILAARWTGETRYRTAVDRLESARLSARAALESVQHDRARTLEHARLLDAASRGPVAARRSVLPELAMAQAALGDAGFLYRVEIDSGGVRLRGEAPRASDILNRLESTPGFRSARNISTASQVEERGLEMFDVRAERAPTTPAREAIR